MDYIYCSHGNSITAGWGPGSDDDTRRLTRLEYGSLPHHGYVLVLWFTYRFSGQGRTGSSQISLPISHMWCYILQCITTRINTQRTNAKHHKDHEFLVAFPVLEKRQFISPEKYLDFKARWSIAHFQWRRNLRAGLLKVFYVFHGWKNVGVRRESPDVMKEWWYHGMGDSVDRRSPHWVTSVHAYTSSTL